VLTHPDRSKLRPIIITAINAITAVDENPLNNNEGFNKPKVPRITKTIKAMMSGEKKSNIKQITMRNIRTSINTWEKETKPKPDKSFNKLS
jgi:hypothetical protein